jgi:hypothetical protein
MRLLLLFGVAAFPFAVLAGSPSGTHTPAPMQASGHQVEKVWVAKQDHPESPVALAPQAATQTVEAGTVWVAKPEVSPTLSPPTAGSDAPLPSSGHSGAHPTSIQAAQLDLSPLPPVASAWVAQQAIASGVSQTASAPLISGSMAAFELPMWVKPNPPPTEGSKAVWVPEDFQEATQAPIVSQGSGGKRRSPNPIARITTDSVEAVADLLPWVDRERKDEPVEDVLARVADELARARAADPEWVVPAERELRALAKRMGALPAPPIGQPANETSLQQAPPSRSYALRPLWPGTDGAPEVRRRPISPTTESGFEMGPSSIADSIGPYIDPDAPPPKQGPDTIARQSSVPQKSPKHSAPKH